MNIKTPNRILHVDSDSFFANREIALDRELQGRPVWVPQREMVEKLQGTDADPLAHKGDWEKRLAKVSKQSRFRP